VHYLVDQNISPVNTESQDLEGIEAQALNLIVARAEKRVFSFFGRH